MPIRVSNAARAASQRTDDAVILRYEPRGAAKELMTCKSEIILLEGPAGTGKSLGALQKIHYCALKYPGSRILCLRKTRVSIRQSLRITWENVVRPHLNGVKFNKDDSEYRYPNGSIVAMGGLDKATKLMSSEWDMVFIQEATEVTEQDVENVSTRLRYGNMPYQQLIMDCNPDKEKHFLNLRAKEGAYQRLISRHEDNPMLWDDKTDTWTERGVKYMGRLDSLHGVRYKRLRLGKWASAEGMVYEEWNASKHYITPYNRFGDWRFYWSVDFGFTNPFVAQLWAVDGSGTLILYREIYKTQTLVEDHARRMLELEEELRVDPVAVICDHDAEGRATLERYLGRETKPAHKAIREGIQAVQARLRPRTDDDEEQGRPRLQIFNYPPDSLDPNLNDPNTGKSLPSCTADEIEGYIWNTANNAKQGEEPVDRDNHGCDAMRYMVCYIDDIGEFNGFPDFLYVSSVEGWMQR